MRLHAVAPAALVALLFSLHCVTAQAFNVSTHELVNEQALRLSATVGILSEFHGLSRGIDTPFAGKTILQWVRRGGLEEDNPFCRSAYHFHDPLKPWDLAGLTDPKGLAFVCSSDSPVSSILWAQRNPQDPARNLSCLPEPPGTPIGGTWSWPETRRCFLRALTSPNRADRDNAWATVFRALGHLVHLVSDASVPEHVRNDAHIGGTVKRAVAVKDGNYEYWVALQHARRDANQGEFIGRYLSNPVLPDPGVLRIVPSHPSAQVPIATLLDTDRYTGDPNITLDGPIGIAEFANANFFSEDTIGIEDGYPAPVLDQRQYRELPTPNGHIRGYYRKGAGDGLPVDPVAAWCVFDEVLDLQGRPREMHCADARVWEQVARAMLPRAVGYSAALLDYFFRGRFEVRTEGSGIRLVNKTTDDETMSGKVKLYYDRENGERAHLSGWEASVDLGAGGESQVLTFPPRPADMAPDSRFMLVFEGRLGAEEGAVFGQLLSPNVVITVQDAGSCAREPLQSLPECPSYSKEGPLTLSAQNGVVELPAAAHAKSDLAVTLGPGIYPYDNPSGLYLNHVSHDHRMLFLEWKEPLVSGTRVEVTVDAIITPNAPACTLVWGRRAPESPTLDVATYEDWPWFGLTGGLQGSVSFRVGGQHTFQVHPDGFMLALYSPGWWYPYPLNPIPAPGVYSGSSHCRLILIRFLTP